jgi:hypothetical protein
MKRSKNSTSAKPRHHPSPVSQLTLVLSIHQTVRFSQHRFFNFFCFHVYFDVRSTDCVLELVAKPQDLYDAVTSDEEPSILVIDLRPADEFKVPTHQIFILSGSDQSCKQMSLFLDGKHPTHTSRGGHS